MSSESDVMVVGAGPTGLVLALLLARRGLRVAVYERWLAHYPLPRAVAFSHDTLRVLQATGHFDELTPSLDFELSKRLKPEYSDASGEVLFSATLATDGFSFFPTMVIFDQPTLEGALNRVCEKEPLIEIHRGWNAASVRQDDDFARVTFDPVDGDQPRPGQPVEASARYVVGCDGANSTMRDLIDVEMVDTGFSESWLVVDLETTPELNAALPVGQNLDPARPTTLVTGAHGRRRFEFMMLAGEGQEISDEANVWQLTKKWGCTPANTKIVRRAVYTFRGRWVKPWRERRILLAGDAAHQMPPFMGQGLNSGLRDAVALSWRFDLIFRGADSSLLDSYTSERLPHVQQIVEQAVELGRIICTLDPERAAMRDNLLRKAQQDLLRMETQGGEPPDNEFLTMTPPWKLGPGIGIEDDPRARFVSIQGRVARGGELGLFDDVVGHGKFVLLAKEPLHSQLSAEALDILDYVRGVPVSLAEDVDDVEGTYSRWLDHLEAAAVLVRPDFYVFGTVDRIGDVDGLVRELGRQLRVPGKVGAV